MKRFIYASIIIAFVGSATALILTREKVDESAECGRYTAALLASSKYSRSGTSLYRPDPRLPLSDRKAMQEGLEPLAERIASPGGLSLIHEETADAIQRRAEAEWEGWTRGYITAALTAKGCKVVLPPESEGGHV